MPALNPIPATAPSAPIPSSHPMLLALGKTSLVLLGVLILLAGVYLYLCRLERRLVVDIEASAESKEPSVIPITPDPLPFIPLPPLVLLPPQGEEELQQLATPAQEESNEDITLAYPVAVEEKEAAGASPEPGMMQTNEADSKTFSFEPSTFAPNVILAIRCVSDVLPETVGMRKLAGQYVPNVFEGMGLDEPEDLEEWLSSHGTTPIIRTPSSRCFVVKQNLILPEGESVVIEEAVAIEPVLIRHAATVNKVRLVVIESHSVKTHPVARCVPNYSRPTKTAQQKATPLSPRRTTMTQNKENTSSAPLEHNSTRTNIAPRHLRKPRIHSRPLSLRRQALVNSSQLSGDTSPLRTQVGFPRPRSAQSSRKFVGSVQPGRPVCR